MSGKAIPMQEFLLEHDQGVSGELRRHPAQ